MKHKAYYLFVTLAMILFASCQTTGADPEKEQIREKIESFEPIEEKKWIVILPGLGCKGCIQEAELFMTNNVGNKNIVFILTKVESIKLLQQKTGIQIKDHPNIFVDREDRFVLNTQNAIYPLIIELENRKLKNYEFQSPKNGMAFSKLEDKLRK